VLSSVCHHSRWLEPQHLNGVFVPISADDCHINIWDIGTGKKLSTFKAHTCVSFFCALMLTSLHRLHLFRFKDAFHYRSDVIHSLSFSADGNLLASVRLPLFFHCTLATLHLFLRFYHASNSTFSFNQDTLTHMLNVAQGSADNTVRIWDAKSGSKSEHLMDSYPPKSQPSQRYCASAIWNFLYRTLSRVPYLIILSP
jgi:WD40 repeat protein